MLNDASEEIWLPKAKFKLELNTASFYKICTHSELNQQMVFNKAQQGGKMKEPQYLQMTAVR